MGHIYLIRLREFIRMGEHIYKLGKTEQPGMKRSKQYPKDSMVEIHLHVNECHSAECELLEFFRRAFIARTDIGAEYFEGDARRMIAAIMRYRYVDPTIPVELPIAVARIDPVAMKIDPVAIASSVMKHMTMFVVLLVVIAILRS